MALTTASQAEYNIPGKPQKISQEAAILFDKSVVARPMSAPEVASIHVKNTEPYYRWVNRLHGHGQVYNQRKAMGFVNATTEDVDVLVGDDTTANDSEIRCGDLVLMKIPFDRWASHVKRNMVVANALQQARGVGTKEENLSGDINSDGGRPSLASLNEAFKGKVTAFEVSDADKIIDGQNEADAAKARKIVADLRSKHSGSK